MGITSSFLATDDKVEGDAEAVDKKVGLRLDKGEIICSGKPSKARQSN